MSSDEASVRIVSLETHRVVSGSVLRSGLCALVSQQVSTRGKTLRERRVITWLSHPTNQRVLFLESHQSAHTAEVVASLPVRLSRQPFSWFHPCLCCSIYSGHHSILIPPSEVETNPALWLSAVSQYRVRDTFCSYGKSISYVTGLRTVDHKSHDPWFHVFLMIARFMTFVTHCTWFSKLVYQDQADKHKSYLVARAFGPITNKRNLNLPPPIFLKLSGR